MSVQTTPHVNFPGIAREALDFYQSVFGGDLMLATYADIGRVEDPAKAGDVAFGRVTAPNGFDIMAYDVQPSKAYDPGQNPFYITMQSDDEAEVRAGWQALAAEARAVLIPLGPADFAPLYGMLTDRFGVTWIVGLMTRS
ncbi:MAG: VOC family protein [Acidimicrobiales bacterium]